MLELPADFLSMLPLSEEEKEKFVLSLNEPSVSSIRKNPLKKVTLPEGNPVAWSRYGYYLPQHPVFTLDPLFHSGAYYVQEASSMFIEQVIMQLSLDEKPIRILDACASPGGKTTHLLSLLHRESLIVANESIRSRQQALIHNVCKWGYNNVVVTQTDVSRFASLAGYFDVILCDAPCSGEGLFRKDTQAVKLWSKENVMHCALRQQRIVNDLWPALKQEGLFIYSTCTYNEEENEKNISHFVNELDADCIKLNIENFNGVKEHIQDKVITYRFSPHKIQGEGFTLSVLRKNNSEEKSLYNKSSKVEEVNANIRKQAGNYILNADESYFFMHQQSVRFFPLSLKRDLALLTGMNITHAGTAIATIKGKDWIPSVELALSTALNTDVNTEAVDKETALRLLKGDTQLETAHPEGYILVTYQQLPLMFVKKTGRRINHLYPREWYIRMKLEQ